MQSNNHNGIGKTNLFEKVEIDYLKSEMEKLRKENTKLWTEIGELRCEIVELNTVINKNIQKKEYILTFEDEIYGQEIYTKKK
jgi:hypothetical protein